MREAITLCLLMLVVLLAALAGSPVFGAGGPEHRVLMGLHEALDIPIESISLRRDYPDHPVAAPERPDRPERKEVRGLRETPNIPVRSIPLRRRHPDHPTGPPGGEGNGCNKDVDLTSTLSGVKAVAAQDNGICTNADIDTYVRNATNFVVQAGGQEAAWTHTNVSIPTGPAAVQFYWTGGSGQNTYTPDVKTFRQGDNDYIVLSLERMASNGFCGVVIVNVTVPSDPDVVAQIYRDGSGTFWCDVHNSFVEDVAGEGRYIYLTADYPNDMRVLDILNLSSMPTDSATCNIAVGTCPITEVGRYTSPTASNSNYVHDITVLNHTEPVGRRVYLAYWNSGLIILDADDVTPGFNPTPIIGPNQLDPAGFLNHHSFASEDGSLVFIQDEFLKSSGDVPVQMWDVSNPASPTYVDGLVLGTDVPVNPAHNLEIRFDIDPERLYVGWYKMGLQAWDFTSAGFVRSNPQPRTAVQYHQAQTEATDGGYDGAWAVRMDNITVDGTTHLYIFQSDRRYGLIVDCVGCVYSGSGADPTTSTITSDPTSIPADGTSTSNITVQLKDSNGNNLTSGGDTVVLSTDLGSISAVADNGNGTYAATLTTGTTAGTPTVTGTLNLVDIIDTATVTFETGPPDPATSTITADPTSILADGTSTSTITVQLKDAKENNQTSGGDTVRLSTDLGLLSPVTDNGDGTYTATLTTGMTEGTTIVSGTLNSVAMVDKATVTFTAPAPETIDITKATYNSRKVELKVEATSSLGGGTSLTATFFDGTSGLPLGDKGMTYNSKKAKWSVTFGADDALTTTKPGKVTVCSSNTCVEKTEIGGGKKSK